VPNDERHTDDPLPFLMGALLKQVSSAVLAADLDGLRVSHLRLLRTLPGEGLRITEIAERTSMTKQACGQFVRHLEATGHVQVAVPPDDRRSRVVLRTPAGDHAVAAFDQVLAGLEERWEAEVGAQRYRSLRAVVVDLLGG
jgi:DNA-binding MarR family transcriptional regulator